MGFGNFEYPEKSEFRVNGDAYVSESLYVGANITVAYWDDNCCAPLYNESGGAWLNGSGVPYSEATCPSCVDATCKGCRREILLSEYIEDTVRQMNLLYKVLFSTTYEVVSEEDAALAGGVPDGSVLQMALRISRDAIFEGKVDIGDAEV